jgi:hypothetical protein
MISLESVIFNIDHLVRLEIFRGGLLVVTSLKNSNILLAMYSDKFSNLSIFMFFCLRRLPLCFFPFLLWVALLSVLKKVDSFSNVSTEYFILDLKCGS